MSNKGKFIVFEGMDGSGKSTISNLLFNHLNEVTEVYKTFEPTDSPFGALARNILNKRILSDEKTLCAVYLADRLDHLQNTSNGILQYLDKGVHVVCDRYYYSSYAYHVPHLSMDWVIQANSACADLLRPDVVFFLDISVEESMHRLQKNRKFLDKYETKEKMTVVRENYLEAINREGEKDNVIIINGERSVEEIYQEVVGIAREVLGLDVAMGKD